MHGERREAMFYNARTNGVCHCFLCPHRCAIAPGSRGRCRVRVNDGGTLYAESYGRIAAVNLDPIEKKPLRGFMPGTKTFSIGTLGCNLDCHWCQNDTLSNASYAEHNISAAPPQVIVEEAKRHRAPSISYTYNEPTVFAEFVIATARLAHAAGVKNVMVSNGYVSGEAMKTLYADIDAANFDVKGFTEDFYRECTGGKLAPVLETVKYLYSQGKHVELTMLIVPGLNDAPAMIEGYLDWVLRELDPAVILHFSAFHPAHRCMNIPPTSPQLLRGIRELALSRGLKNIQLGNI